VESFLNNLLSQFSQQIDITKLLANIIPGLRGKKGRPRKVKWDEQVAKGVVASKVGLAFCACQALMKKGVMSSEEMMVVLGYCFPSSSKWVVREALKTFGRADAEQISASWDEISGVISELVQAYQQGQAQSQLVQQFQKVTQKR
jgi:hypothetical protein